MNSESLNQCLVALEDYLGSGATVQEELLSGQEGIKKAARDRKKRIQEQMAKTDRALAKEKR